MILLHTIDPVHGSKEETNGSYHRNMGYVLSQDGTFLCVASHNSETVNKAKEQYVREYTVDISSDGSMKYRYIEVLPLFYNAH